MTSKITQADIDQAASLLQAGKLVAFPTETVYGLGADAANPTAIARLYAIKRRPPTRPIALLLADKAQLKEWVAEISPAAQQLAEHFWPGPLTLVLPRAPHILAIITAQQETVGIRVPDHSVAQALLKAFGGPLAVSSANRSGKGSLMTAAQVQQELDNEIDLILADKPCTLGIESTVIDVAGKQPHIIRLGAISAAQISNVLGCPIT